MEQLPRIARNLAVGELAEHSDCEIQTAEEENGEEGDHHTFHSALPRRHFFGIVMLILSSRLSNIAFGPHRETKTG